MTYNLVPVQRAESPYLNGFQMAWVSNTTFSVADGVCSDSLNAQDINVNTAGVGTTINGAINGLNGLDTGSLAASTMYYVYAIMDQSGYNAPGFVLSASSTTPTLPAGLLPSGYSNYRLVGTILTDGSSHFLLFYMNGGNGSQKYIQYDAPVTVTVTASGTSATYSAMDLSVAVPLVNFGRVQCQYQWTNNAAADIVNFQPAGATGDAYAKKGIAAGVQQDENLLILPLIASSVPKVSYKTSSGGSTLNSFKVQGFELNL